MEIDLTGLVLPERAETTEVSEDGTTGVFVIEPLERGFGHTLGNSVRRVLLSSLRGAAIWGFRIDGVVHEHQTIQGVVEDVHQVIQNLKSLVVVLDDDVQEAVLTVRAEEAGPVTAGMISPPAGVETLDPGHQILTLQDDRELNIELHVNKGRGFVLADAHELPEGAAVDLVRIDAVYNPVRRANFTVEETRVGQRTDFDRLTLRVETDGSVEPEWALRYASELARKHLEYLHYFGEGGIPRPAPPGVVPVPERLQGLFTQPLEDLTELTARARNSLQKEHIETLADLVQKTEADMLDIDNFGKKSLMEMERFLDEQNLRFGMKLQEDEDGRLYFVEEGADSEPAEAEVEAED